MLTHMRKNLLSLLLLVISFFSTSIYNVNAQSKRKVEVRNKANDPMRRLTPERELSLALGLLGQGAYFDAIDYFQSLKEKDERNPFLSYSLAECYARTRDYVPSAHYYVEAYNIDRKDYPISSFYAGLMFKQQAEYQQAIKWFTIFLADNKKTSSQVVDIYGRIPDQKIFKDLKKRAQVEIDGCIMAMNSIKEPEPVNIFNAGPNVNSAYTELSPYPLGDTALLFSTVNPKKVAWSTGREGASSRNVERFMIAQKQPGFVDSFQWPLPFYDGKFNQDGVETGNGCYSPGGDRFYFTKCTVEDSFAFVCKIYYSRFEIFNWGPPILIGANVNEPPKAGERQSSSTMPFVAKVGKKEVLFFASNRKLQSRGGYDLWYSIIDPRSGEFRRPQNCGKQINSKVDELTPYYNTKEGKLYFSSNGLKSFGGFDIYSAEGGPSRYKNIKNMGYPINTSADEFYFIKDPMGKPDAYVVSNRVGSIALKNPTCCNDIWRIQYEPKLAVMGRVVDKKTQELLSQAVVKIADQKGDVNTYNSEDGNFLFNIQRNKSYVLTADKPGYTSSRATVSTMAVKRSDPDDTVIVTIYLDSIRNSFSVSNIYYTYDEATLRPESVASLDTLVNFMKDNPSISVEIYSFTDGKGTKEYNEKLSQRRAQSVVDYLEKSGVERSRMFAKGLGDKNKVASEVKDGNKDNPEARQLNRRTEFRIIGDLPTRRVLYNSALPGTMDQQQRNLAMPEEAEDEAPAPGAKKDADAE
jgi:outer membrane protein OmpA-like peptidoglycan-associated protein